MGTQEKRLIIRADGNTHIGTGHVMRCIALAQAWQERGGSVSFALAQHTPALRERLSAEEIAIHLLACEPGGVDDAMQTIALAQQVAATWVVVDGYHFAAAYQQAIKATGVSLLVIDDYGHAEHYYADLVLNQNISASEQMYTNREPYTRLLLGTRYTLLRREFLTYRGWKHEVPEVARKILVTMGGGDPDNVTLKVIHALKQVAQGQCEVVIVVGGSNPYIETLQRAVDAMPHIKLVQNVADMPEYMAWADIAIAAGGSTCWELALFGLPMLLIPIANNQLSIAQKLGELEVALVVGWYEDVSADMLALALNQLMQDQEKRLRMSQTGQVLVDGEGGERVVMYMYGDALRLRTVQESDCALLWEWANEPAVRTASFNSHPISWDEHTRWFAKKYQSPNTIMYIALDSSDTPIGQVRFERNAQNEAIISVSIDHHQRGKGYGKGILQRSGKEIFSLWDTSLIHSYIKEDNISSIRAFEQAGYQQIEQIETCGSLSQHLILHKNEIPLDTINSSR